MSLRHYIYIFILTFSNITLAEEDAYKLCFVRGYYFGAEDQFLGGLAAHIIYKKGLPNDPLCSAAHKIGYEVGVRFSRTGKLDGESDAKIIKYASEFSDKVYEALSSKIKF